MNPPYPRCAAAEGGVVEGAWELADCYDEGLGVPRDPAAAAAVRMAAVTAAADSTTDAQADAPGGGGRRVRHRR